MGKLDRQTLQTLRQTFLVFIEVKPQLLQNSHSDESDETPPSKPVNDSSIKSIFPLQFFVFFSLVLRVFLVLAVPWEMPSSLMDHTQPKTRYTWPESYGTVPRVCVCCGLDSVCPVKHVPPLKKHPWALFKLDSEIVYIVGQLFVGLSDIQEHVESMWTSGLDYK